MASATIASTSPVSRSCQWRRASGSSPPARRRARSSRPDRRAAAGRSAASPPASSATPSISSVVEPIRRRQRRQRRRAGRVASVVASLVALGDRDAGRQTGRLGVLGPDPRGVGLEAEPLERRADRRGGGRARGRPSSMRFARLGVDPVDLVQPVAGRAPRAASASPPRRPRRGTRPGPLPWPRGRRAGRPAPAAVTAAASCASYVRCARRSASSRPSARARARVASSQRSSAIRRSSAHRSVAAGPATPSRGGVGGVGRYRGRRRAARARGRPMAVRAEPGRLARARSAWAAASRRCSPGERRSAGSSPGRDREPTRAARGPDGRDRDRRPWMPESTARSSGAGSPRRATHRVGRRGRVTERAFDDRPRERSSGVDLAPVRRSAAGRFRADRDERVIGQGGRPRRGIASCATVTRTSRAGGRPSPDAARPARRRWRPPRGSGRGPGN